jgi:hypothetical protein
VFEYADGCRRAGSKVLLIASNKLDEGRDQPKDLWVWDVEYDNCAEGRHDLILSDGPSNAADLEAFLNEMPYLSNGRSLAVGWIWPLIRDECSAVNNTVDINTTKGADMMRVLLTHHQRYQFPCVMLTMDGRGEGGGEWGMRTWFVNQVGVISKGAQRMLSFVGSDPNPDLGNGNGNGGNGDTPSGWYSIKTAPAYLKFQVRGDRDDVAAAIALLEAGTNHIDVAKVALEPAQMEQVLAELKALG